MRSPLLLRMYLLMPFNVVALFFVVAAAAIVAIVSIICGRTGGGVDNGVAAAYAAFCSSGCRDRLNCPLTNTIASYPVMFAFAGVGHRVRIDVRLKGAVVNAGTLVESVRNAGQVH